MCFVLQFVMKDIFWADTSLLESVGEHEKHIDNLREDMCRAIRQALIPLIAYARANEQFLELINTDINAYIKLEQKTFLPFFFMFSIFRPCLNMEKIIHSTRAYFYVYLPVENVRTSDVSWELENFLSPSYSKFAVEWDSTRKVSRIRTQFGFLEEKMDFLETNLILFSKLVMASNFL